MTTEATIKRTAYIFEDVGGWYMCDDDAGVLDTRGSCYPSKNAAIASLRAMFEEGHTNYTHYKTGKTNPRKL